MLLFAQAATSIIPDPGGWTDFFVKIGFPGGIAVFALVACGLLVWQIIRDPKRDARMFGNTLNVILDMSEQRHKREESGLKHLANAMIYVIDNKPSDAKAALTQLIDNLNESVDRPVVIDLDADVKKP